MKLLGFEESGSHEYRLVVGLSYPEVKTIVKALTPVIRDARLRKDSAQLSVIKMILGPLTSNLWSLKGLYRRRQEMRELAELRKAK